MQSVKKQLEQKPFKEKQLDKSKGIFEDYDVKKSVQSREIVANSVKITTLPSKSALATDANGTIISGTSASGTSVPIGGIIAWLKSYTNTPSLPNEFVECNGQTLDKSSSPFHTQVIPDLNGAIAATKYFIRGNTTSGGVGGAMAHNHDVVACGVVLSGLTLGAPDSTANPDTGYSCSTMSVASDSHGHDTSGATADISACNGTSSEEHLPPYYNVVWVMRVL